MYNFSFEVYTIFSKIHFLGGRGPSAPRFLCPCLFLSLVLFLVLCWNKYITKSLYVHVYYDRSYRLRSKRPLKNLMMNISGCDYRSAGIGDIAYVKDLLTKKILTTQLRCSKFGFAYHHLVKYGWVWVVLVTKYLCFYIYICSACM